MQCVKCAQQGAIWVLGRDRGLIKRINSGCCSEIAVKETFQDIIKILSSETKLCYDS